MVIRALQQISVDVARTMHDMDDVQMAARRIFVGIAQKDHIVAERGAAIIAAQLRPCPPHETGKLGDVLAVIRELVDEGVRNGAAFTFARDVSSDLGDVAARRCPINQLRHLTRRCQTEAIEVIARMAAHVVGGVTAALGLRRRKLGAELDQLGLIDGMADGILGRSKSARGKLRLHPLGRIWCQFNFQRVISS
jgi:hypothetical protein